MPNWGANINLRAADEQWEAGFPQLLLYSGDTVWRESVGSLTLLFYAPSVAVYGLNFKRCQPSLRSKERMSFIRRRAIVHVINDLAVILIRIPPSDGRLGQSMK
jgi:hypothetical protein